MILGPTNIGCFPSLVSSRRLPKQESVTQCSQRLKVVSMHSTSFISQQNFATSFNSSAQKNITNAITNVWYSFQKLFLSSLKIDDRLQIPS